MSTQVHVYGTVTVPNLLDTIARILLFFYYIHSTWYALFVPRGDTDLDTHTHTVKKLIEIL